MTFNMTKFTVSFQERSGGYASAIRNLKAQYKPVFIKCAVTFMAIKLGLIFLATFAAMAYFLSPAARFLAIETSIPKAMLLVSPLIFVIVVKVCFIIKILITYNRSRAFMKRVVNYVWLKGRERLRHAKESLPVGLHVPSRERVKSPRF